MIRELGAELAARLDPSYPRGNPVDPHPGRGVDGRRPRPRRADRARARPDRPGRRGQRLEQLGGDAGRARRPAAPLLAGRSRTCRRACRASGTRSGSTSSDRFCRGASLPGMPGVSMGQNNDVAWSFTNVMADVKDLFVERIEGDTLRVRGRVAAAGGDRGGDRGQGPRRSPSASDVRETHHGPIVNEALGADDAEPLALRWHGPRLPGASRGRASGCSTSPAAPSWSSCSASTRTPVSNLVWADRHGSIGYKMVGRMPMRRGGCPDLPKPGWTGEFEWEGWIPYDELPELADPESGLPRHRQQPDRRRRLPAPHHQRLAGRLPRAADRGAARGASREHDLESFEAMQTDISRSPGWRPPTGWPGCGRETSASWRRSSGCRAGTGGSSPDSIAATIYQAFTAAAGARGHPGGDRRPRPRRALARPRRQRLHRPRHLAVALAVAPARRSGRRATRS